MAVTSAHFLPFLRCEPVRNRFFTAKKAMTVMVAQNESDLAWMTSRIEAGKIKVMIGRVYSLDQAKEALAHSEAGKARGKIVLKMI
jgi:NADPH:quinone reductase-like Zn-dependent oxidoreductase